MNTVYTVTHEGPLEIHRVEIHQVDLMLGAKHIDRELYSRCRMSDMLSDKILALALIVKAIEKSAAESTDKDAETTDPIPFPKNGTSE